jgi:hypothetical protein
LTDAVLRRLRRSIPKPSSALAMPAVEDLFNQFPDAF